MTVQLKQSDAPGKSVWVDGRLWVMIALLAAILGPFIWIDARRVPRLRTISTSTTEPARAQHTGDFQHFYYASRAILEGKDPYTAFTNGYIYPPMPAILGTPLALLNIETAAYVALGLNVVILLLALYLAANEMARRLAHRNDALALTAIVLFAVISCVDKVRGELRMWQTNGVTLLMLALGLRWSDRRPVLCGVALGFAFDWKYLTILYLPYLLLRRRFVAAASFVVAAAIGLFAPAILFGMKTNAHYLAVAFSGMAKMVGMDVGQRPTADIAALSEGRSVSLTSAFARIAQGNNAVAFGFVAIAAGACLVFAWRIYRKHRLPLFAWPSASKQRAQPFVAAFAIEWAALEGVTLVFGPQTNTRHLVITLLCSVAAGTILLYRRSGVNRAVLIAGVLAMMAAFMLPPGNRDYTMRLEAAWTRVGGPCWGLLIFVLTLLAAGIAQATASRSAEVNDKA